MSLALMMLAASIVVPAASLASPPTTIPVGSFPSDLAYDSANNYVDVANLYSSSVSVISASTNTVVSAVSVGSLPHHIAFDPNNNLVYVPDYGSGTVSIISGSSLLATFATGAAPLGASYNAHYGKMAVSVFGAGCPVANAGMWWFSGTAGIQQLNASNGLSDVMAYDPSTGYTYV